MPDMEDYTYLLDEIDAMNDVLKDLELESALKDDEISKYRNFARWLAWCMTSEQNAEIVCELAMRKLCKIGVVEEKGDEWVFEWDTEEPWYKNILSIDIDEG